MNTPPDSFDDAPARAELAQFENPELPYWVLQEMSQHCDDWLRARGLHMSQINPAYYAAITRGAEHSANNRRLEKDAA